MWYWYAALALIAFWWFFLRPRYGGKNAPPLVTESSLFPVPFVGVLSEFLKSPNDMMRRCYNDYGQVFTIPVSATTANGKRQQQQQQNFCNEKSL